MNAYETAVKLRVRLFANQLSKCMLEPDMFRSYTLSR